MILLILLALHVTARGATTTNPATTQALDLRAPTRVTLKLDHTPVVDALRSLFKQAEIPSDEIVNDAFAQQVSDMTVTAELVDQPFCVALVEICRQAYLEPEFVNLPQSSRTLQLAIRKPRVAVSRTRGTAGAGATTRGAGATTRGAGPTTRPSMRGLVFRTGPRNSGGGGGPRNSATTQPSWVDAPMVASGPFVFVAHDVHRFSRIDFESDRGADPVRTMELNLVVLRDPKLRLIGLGERIDVDEASDDAGVSLLPETTQEPAQIRPVANRLMNPSRIGAILSYPPGETSRAIAVFHGHLSATLISRTQSVELVKDGAAVKAGEAQTVGEVHFRVDKFEPFGGGGGTQIILTLPYASPDGQSHSDDVRALLHPDLLRVTDADGHADSFNVTASVRSIRGDINECGVAITMHPSHTSLRGNAAKPVKVVWDVPVEVTDVNIPFELKNLPVP